MPQIGALANRFSDEESAGDVGSLTPLTAFNHRSLKTDAIFFHGAAIKKNSPLWKRFRDSYARTSRWQATR